jgi:hypothetical protein
MKSKDILKYSNPKKVFANARKYLGKKVIIRLSTRDEKKYMVYNPTEDKWVHFGQMGYEDFTKHKDQERREDYLERSGNMHGEWRNNPYSANNLARNLLW